MRLSDDIHNFIADFFFFFKGWILLLLTEFWKPIQSLEANEAPRTF